MSEELDKKMEKGFEEMALMIANGFKETHNRIEALASKLDSMRRHVEGKLDGHEARIHMLEEHTLI